MSKFVLDFANRQVGSNLATRPSLMAGMHTGWVGGQIFWIIADIDVFLIITCFGSI